MAVSPDRSDLVTPFRAEQYSALPRLSELIAPPYDVIDSSARERLAARDPCNVVHLILPRGDRDRYAMARRLLAGWRQSGALIRDPEPAIYILRQESRTPGGDRVTRTGLIGAVTAEPFEGGRVRPHERTHAGPKQDRLALLEATATMCECLLMLSRDRSSRLADGLRQATAAAPLATATLEGVGITLWRVSGDVAGQLARAAGVEPLYIADGHHRYETAVAYRARNPAAARTLALIVPARDPGLVVLATHRVIPPPLGDGTDCFAAMTPFCDVEPASRTDATALLEALGSRGGCVLWRQGHQPVLLVRRADRLPPALTALPQAVRDLDVAWADGLVVPACTGGDDRTLAYTPDPEEAVRKAATSGGAAILLNPPAVDQILAVADASAFMPPKATYFTPKVPSGLVFLSYP